MERRRNRYKEMERYMTYILLGDTALFLLYLLVAGLGVAWLKVFISIVVILVSGLCITYLYLTGELLRYRSRWLSIGFAAIVLCLIVSLVLNYPSPDPMKNLIPDDETTAAILNSLNI